MIAFWHSTLILALTFGMLGGMASVDASPTPARPEYTTVIDWAKSRKLTPTWVKRDDLLLLTGQSTRVLLKINSRQAAVNGVRVWLLYPVIQQGKVLLANADIKNTLDPILAPTRGSKRIVTICLDPGHGGKDPGLRSGLRAEKTYTLLLATELREQLTRQKFKVISTRTTDAYVDLGARPELAKRRGADLFLSLHFNAAGPATYKTASGSEVFALTPPGTPSSGSGWQLGSAGAFPGNRNDRQNVFLAYEVQKSLSKLGIQDRGVQRSRFVVLKDATMPAILVEAGFMSHPVESRKIYDPAYRKRIAKAIVDGLIAYKKAVDPKR